mmetsp:Transcript_31240/g.92759  ORF Transcript_31240/g.92759 Transcript_31240/m.92759 type:complete len:228 (-) Transcript_31240:1026-1709(-)
MRRAAGRRPSRVVTTSATRRPLAQPVQGLLPRGLLPVPPLPVSPPGQSPPSHSLPRPPRCGRLPTSRSRTRTRRSTRRRTRTRRSTSCRSPGASSLAGPAMRALSTQRACTAPAPQAGAGATRCREWAGSCRLPKAPGRCRWWVGCRASWRCASGSRRRSRRFRSHRAAPGTRGAAWALQTAWAITRTRTLRPGATPRCGGTWMTSLRSCRRGSTWTAGRAARRSGS